MSFHQGHHLRSNGIAKAVAVLRHYWCRSASWPFLVTILHGFAFTAPPATVSTDAPRQLLSFAGTGGAIRAFPENTIFFNLSSLFRYTSLYINKLAC